MEDIQDIIRVGACSMVAIPGDVDENIDKIKKFCKQAIEDKVELLLFPELSLSGYWISTELHYEAQPRDGPAIKELISFLNDMNSDLVISVGLAESYGGCIYNCQIMLDRNGERYYYRKTHWPNAEVGTWGCGDRYPIHSFKGIKIGTAICYDNNFPEVHRIYGLQGTDIILSPYAYGKKFDYNDPASIKASIKAWKDHEIMVLTANAALNYQWVIACVGGGHVKDYIVDETPGKGFEMFVPGVILFISPEGKVVKQTPDDKIEETLLWMDVSRLSNIEHRKGTNNFFKNRRITTYGRLLELP
jgi:predicted amidohydrolase